MNDTVNILKKLIDEKAISFMKSKENEYNRMYEVFVKMHPSHCIIGVDLAKNADRYASLTMSKAEI